jgi:hypothetical protein
MDKRLIGFIIIMVIGIALRIVFLTSQTPFLQKDYQGVLPDSNSKTRIVTICLNDEAAHWNYCVYLRELKTLPKVSWPCGANFTDSTINQKYKGIRTYENYQFPLYYIFQSIFAFGSPQVARIWNVLLTLMAVILIWLVSKNLWAISFIMLLPASLTFLTYISNDVAIFLAAAVLAYGLAKKSFPWYAVGLFLCATTKMQGLLICGAMAIWFWRDKKYLLTSLAACVVGIIIFVIQYDLYKVNGYIYPAGLHQPELWFIYVISQTVVSAIHTENFPPNFLLMLMPVTTVLVGATVWGVYKSVQCKYISVYTFAAGAVSVTVLIFSLTHVFYQGRLLYPMIPFLAVNWREYGKRKNCK